MSLISGRLDLHRTDFVVPCQQKIDFLIMFSTVSGEGVIVKFVA